MNSRMLKSLIRKLKSSTRDPQIYRIFKSRAHLFRTLFTDARLVQSILVHESNIARTAARVHVLATPIIFITFVLMVLIFAYFFVMPAGKPAVLLAYLGFCSAIISVLILQRFFRLPIVFRIVLVLAVGGLATLSYYSVKQPDVVREHSILTGYSVGSVMVFIVGFFVYATDRLQDYILTKEHPQSVFVISIVDICICLSNSRVWANIDQKRNIMRSLEDVASVMERRMPRLIVGFDGASDVWIRIEAKKIAAAFRNYKKWVFKPMPETREVMLGRMREILWIAVTGEWHHLPRSEPERLTASAIRANTLRVLGTIARSASPVVLLFIWKSTPFAPPPALFDKLSIATVAICAGYLLLGLDPAADAKVRTAGSLVQLFSKDRSRSD